MKRILLFVVGYYLIIQAGLGVLASCGQPENAVIIWIISAAFGYFGYVLVEKARNINKPETETEKPIDSPKE